METLTLLEFVCKHVGYNNLPIGYLLDYNNYVCGILIKSAFVIPSRKFGDSVTTIKLYPITQHVGASLWKLFRAENLVGLASFESGVRFHVIPSRRLNTLNCY